MLKVSNNSSSATASFQLIRGPSSCTNKTSPTWLLVYCYQWSCNILLVTSGTPVSNGSRSVAGEEQGVWISSGFLRFRSGCIQDQRDLILLHSNVGKGGYPSSIQEMNWGKWFLVHHIRYDWVSGLSFKMASISTIMVYSVVKLIDACPSTFFRVVLVRPIKRSQNPPYQVALYGMNGQFRPCLLRNSFNDCDLNNSVNSSAAVRYGEALSEIICWGADFRAANVRYARRKVCTDKFVNTSRWTAHVVAYVKRQM